MTLKRKIGFFIYLAGAVLVIYLGNHPFIYLPYILVGLPLFSKEWKELSLIDNGRNDKWISDRICMYVLNIFVYMFAALILGFFGYAFATRGSIMPPIPTSYIMAWEISAAIFGAWRAKVYLAKRVASKTLADFSGSRIIK